jgi:hypothetical protein
VNTGSSPASVVCSSPVTRSAAVAALAVAVAVVACRRRPGQPRCTCSGRCSLLTVAPARACSPSAAFFASLAVRTADPSAIAAPARIASASARGNALSGVCRLRCPVLILIAVWSATVCTPLHPRRSLQCFCFVALRRLSPVPSVLYDRPVVSSWRCDSALRAHPGCVIV